MILDSLENASRYFPLHPGFEAAFEFLKRGDLAELPFGRNEIAGEQLHAMAMRDKGKGKDAAKFESHRQFIDIQFTVEGHDDIAWEDLAVCEPDENGYMPESDATLFSNPPSRWTTVPAGYFVIFFPEDAHAPMGTDEVVHKVVVKVAVDWNE